MSKQNHTPGPWENFLHSSDGKHDGHIIAARGAGIARIWHVDGLSPVHLSQEFVDANARLITAAPELLAVANNALADLEGILPEFEPSGDRTHPAWQTIEELRQVINRATGEQP